MRHKPPFGIMRQFMERGAIKIDRLEKAGLIGNADAVVGGVVIGMFAAALEPRAACADERFGDLDGKALRDLLGLDGVFKGKAVALCDVEHREALEEGNAPLRAPGGVASAVTGFLGDETIGVNDGGAALALANLAAEGQRLLVSEPLIDLEAARKQRIPQQHDIDAAIGALRGGIARDG